MARTPRAAEPKLISLQSAKLKKLVIRNFRCIESSPVKIDLDDIVVLVGPNNAGKSTILRAYEVVMMHGSTEGRLKIEDFPSETVDSDNLSEIELQTYLVDDFPAEHWLHTDDIGRKFVRERWRWEGPNIEPARRPFENPCGSASRVFSAPGALSNLPMHQASAASDAFRARKIPRESSAAGILKRPLDKGIAPPIAIGIRRFHGARQGWLTQGGQFLIELRHLPAPKSKPIKSFKYL